MKVTETSEYKEDFLHKGTECQKNQNQKRAGSGFCYFTKPEPMWPRIGKHV